MTKIAKPIGPFDDQKLLELTEPIAVSVHKIMHGRPCPMNLPVKPGEDVSGRGWTQDEVKQLDQFLVEHLSGGGEYHNSATGDNGVQMKWRAYFPIDRYPEKGVISSQPAPPASGNGVQLGAAPAAMQVVPPTPVYMPPPGWMHAAAASMPQAATQPQAQQWMQPQQVWPQPSYQSTLFESRRDSSDREVQKEREARLALEAKIERERLENTYTAQLNVMSQEIRALKEMKPQGDSPELVAVRAELAALQKAREDDKLAQMVREVQSSTQQQIAALTQMMQQQQAAAAQAAAISAATPKGPDPMIMMLVESGKQQAAAQLEIARLQADAQKEAARLQAEAQKEAARTALGPRELIDIMARANSGHEQISNAYTRLMETTQRSFENMMQMQGPQTHPAIEIVQQGMQGIAGIAERYITAKESATANQAHATAAVAQAHAQAQVAQAQLAQASVTTPVSVDGDEDDEEENSETDVDAMERELFGSALPAVHRLRKGIALGQGDPKAACDAVLQGIDHFQKKGEPIPAFALWQKNELQQLVKVLVPDALASFQQQMIAHLFEARKTVFKG